jgi:GT2 family glycosyltransferase
VHFVHNPANRGYAGGNNAGITFALERGADWICLLNNDTTVDREFADVMIAQAQSAEAGGFGVIGPLIMSMADPEIVMTDGCRFNDAQSPGFFERHVIPIGQPLTEVDIVNGCCLMISARALADAGIIDEQFFLIHEESDLCLRVRARGMRCGVFGMPLVWHKGSSSFRRTGNNLQRYFDARNLWMLISRHADGMNGTRAKAAARVQYFKYVYYRYCLEREDGQRQGADAVVEGVHDALLGRYGLRVRRARPFVPALRGLFEAGRLGARLKRFRPMVRADQ